MKRIIYIFTIFSMVFACSNEVEFNTPAMQANKEGVTWRADYFAGDIDFGGFLFEGGTRNEVLQLITPTDGLGVFQLGSGSTAVALYKGFDGTVYSTLNESDPSVTLYPIEGEISILEIDNSTPKRVSGEFYFTAFSEDGLRSVNFIRGVFHRIPLVGGLVALGDGNACLQATTALNVAQQAFNLVTVTDPNYNVLCQAYKAALQDAIDACGDVTGSYQTAIDSLGDCM